MEFSSLSVMILLTVLIHCGNTQEKPTVRVRPQNTVYTGDTVNLTCELQSTGWTFNWYKNNPDHQDFTNEAPDYTVISENTISVKVMNKGTIGYYCSGQRGDYSTDYTDSAKITVKERPKAKVKVDPAERVFSGDTVTLICDINSGENWNYEWFKNNKPLSDDQRKKKKKEYIISNVDQYHEGDYSCRGTQLTEPRYSEISDAVTLTVSEKPKPTVSVRPQNTVYTGDTVNLTCELQSTGWTFYWYKHNKDHQEYTNEAPDYTVISENTISVKVMNKGTIGYYCGAQREDYNTHYSESAKITVKERPKAKVKVDPAERVFSGDTVTLICDINSGENWNYEWFKNNTPLSDVQRKKKEYIISNVTKSHEGVYSCRGTQLTEPRYSEISDAVKLTVSERTKAKVKVTLICDINSGDNWNYEWFKNNEPLSDDQKKKEYVISNVDQYHEGVYSCKGTKLTESHYSETSDAVTLIISVSGSAPYSVLSLFSSLMAVSPFVVVSIILAVKCYRARAKPVKMSRMSTVIEAERSS